MVDIDEHDAGMPIWIDAMVSSAKQLAALMEFYSGVFAWTWDHGPEETGYYSIARHRGRAVMGLGQMEATTGTIVTYFSTHDAAESVARAESLGASVIVGPTPIMTLGTMALLLDPTGAVHGLWQPQEFHGFGALYEVGAPGWFDHVSSDPAAAARYYGTLTGHALLEPEPGLRILTKGEQWFASLSSPQVLVGQTHWNPVFLVTSLAETRDAVIAHGGSVLVEEMPVPGSAISAFLEPVCGSVVTVMRMGDQP
jgi:uncharacterized protein